MMLGTVSGSRIEGIGSDQAGNACPGPRLEGSCGALVGCESGTRTKMVQDWNSKDLRHRAAVGHMTRVGTGLRFFFSI